MREIKFRAWNVTQEGMVTNANHLIDLEGLKGHKFELMQFTGLKDKKGKEIYEGDCFPYGYVEFDSGCFSLKVTKKNIHYDIGQSIYLCDFLAIFRKVRIVGNIYENPELLKR